MKHLFLLFLMEDELKKAELKRLIKEREKLEKIREKQIKALEESKNKKNKEKQPSKN